MLGSLESLSLPTAHYIYPKIKWLSNYNSQRDNFLVMKDGYAGRRYHQEPGCLIYVAKYSLSLKEFILFTLVASDALHSFSKQCSILT